MFLTTARVPAQTRISVNSFLGLDRRDKAAIGTFAAMKNMTSDGYPTLTTRQKRSVVTSLAHPHGLAVKDSLVWVDGNVLYINGAATGVTLSNTDKTLISMGAYLIIFPDKKYINTCDLTDWGSLEHTASITGHVNFSLCRADGAEYENYTAGTNAPLKPEAGALWLNSGEKPPVLEEYDGESWETLSDVYVKISAVGIGAGFAEGDGVIIKGCGVETLNGRHTLALVQSDAVVIEGCVSGAMSQSGGLTVRRAVPDMDFVVESGNRLWGCKYGMVDGVTVNEIYASKLGDFKNWYCYAGLATDSYAASRGSDGPWTGAVTYLGNPIFFKENCMERVYANPGGAHQIVTTECPGVKKGSAGSLACVDGVLYYQGTNGVFAFDGSLPMPVSQPLGEEKLHGAVAGGCNGKYYMSTDEGWYVYDARKNIWHAEDNLAVRKFVCCDGELYCLTGDGRILSVHGETGTQEEDFDWFAQSGELGLDVAENKYLQRLELYLRLADEAMAEVFVSYDEGKTWEKQGTMTGGSGQGIRTRVLYVRPKRCRHLRVKVAGVGQCRIYSWSAVYEKGSDGV